MRNAKHVMIDLETLGSTPGCAILSIGAVEFCPALDVLGKELYVNIDLQSCFSYGLSAEGQTFYWWLKQSDQARYALMLDNKSLHKGLELLTEFLQVQLEGCFVWSHGSSFDLAVLSAAYQKVGFPKPWQFRKERDTRTLLDVAGLIVPRSANAHHALEDAKMQALMVMQAIRERCHDQP